MREMQSFIDVDFGNIKMPIIAIYNNPSDYPGEFIGRLFDSGRPTEFFVRGRDEADVIKKIPPRFMRFERDPSDEPHIVCTYL